ncbi:DUF4124 domain-containing protein [Beggiatoa alba]|nr:DUF4124 domain-containing protein [Beggiatoa alba]
MRYLLLFSLILASHSVFAGAIYKSTAPDGSITFSDNPTDGAKEITLKPITTFSAKEAAGKSKATSTPATTSADPQAADTPPGNYKKFTITSPANDTTLQTGDAGNTTIQTTVEPALNVKNGHRLSVLVDGTQLDRVTSSSSISINNLDRGTHSIRAVIVNKSGDIVQLSSNSITLHVQRATIFGPSNPRNPRR